MKLLTILGSTGSIGRSTLDLVSRHPDRFRVVALAAGRNIELLERQIHAFRPRLVAVADREAAKDLQSRLGMEDVRVVSGKEGLIEAASFAEADVVVSAMVGMVGLAPTLAAIEAGHTIALANKEPLVMANPADRLGTQRRLPVSGGEGGSHSPADPDRFGRPLSGPFAKRTGNGHAAAGRNAPELVHGSQNFGGFGHHDEQGA